MAFDRSMSCDMCMSIFCCSWHLRSSCSISRCTARTSSFLLLIRRRNYSAVLRSLCTCMSKFLTCISLSLNILWKRYWSVKCWSCRVCDSKMTWDSRDSYCSMRCTFSWRALRLSSRGIWCRWMVLSRDAFWVYLSFLPRSVMFSMSRTLPKILCYAELPFIDNWDFSCRMMVLTGWSGVHFLAKAWLGILLLEVYSLYRNGD